MIIKQGKQIRALYELQKKTNEKLVSIDSQVKKQNKKNDTDLSPKVFNVSIFILKHNQSILFLTIYRYILIYRKDIPPCATIIFQRTCGPAMKISNMVWKVGLKLIIQIILRNLGSKNGRMYLAENIIVW
jgi:hypothetical protein